MSTTTHRRPTLSRPGTTWVLGSPTSTLELTIKHRFGPVSLTGAVRLTHALLKVDTTGRVRIAFAIDTDSVEPTGRRDPRERAYRPPAVDAGGTGLWFQSTEVADRADGS